MWFHKEKLAQAARSNNLKWAWLAQRLGCSVSMISKIASGERSANCQIARALLEVFGYAVIVAAIDWGRTRYAS